MMLDFIHLLFQVKYLSTELLLDVGRHVKLRFEHHYFVFEFGIFTFQVMLLGLLTLKFLFDLTDLLVHLSLFLVFLHEHLVIELYPLM